SAAPEPAARREDQESSALLTATRLPVKIFALAAPYASIEPCQSRWSAARLSTAPETGASEEDQCSWKLDSSTASTRCPARTASTTGRPTLPQATASSSAACKMASSIPTVVVLPLVPVTAIQSAGVSCSWFSRQASSTSPTTSRPASVAAASSGASGFHPGLVTTRSVPAGGSSNPGTSSAPCACKDASAARRSAEASVTVTAAPAPSSACAADRPDTPAPATSTLRPSKRLATAAPP